MANISLSGVVKNFGQFTAVDHIDAEIADGEFVTLLGPSGCGKTTLLNLISGFLQPSGGTIFIGGKDVSRLPPEKRDTAMCFQSYALFPHLSVFDNIGFGLRQLKGRAGEIEKRVSELAGQLDLTAHLQKLPNALSGGQQQRVALGRALAIRPGVILFDEPLSNLDAKLRESVRFEIRRIQSEARLTAIYVTHDQSEALAMSDRIFVMNAGHVEQCGTPLEIYNAPATRFVADFIGAANIVEGEVLRKRGDDIWQFATPLGDINVQGGRAPTAKHHYLSWRPENAKLAWSGDAPRENLVTSQLRETAFQGAYSDIFVDANGVRQRVQAPGSVVSSGHQITFHIPPGAIQILEPVL